MEEAKLGIDGKRQNESKKTRLDRGSLPFAIRASVAALVLTGILPGHMDSILASDNRATTPLTEGHPLQKVTVGDIQISYRIFGNGEPLLLLHGFGGSMDVWDPTLLKLLSESHTVIVFNNRGVGNTTLGEKQYSMSQLAEDASGLLDALGIHKADVMGWSMGGMIAQELAVSHPDRINRLILYATSCGGEGFIPPQQDALNAFANRSGSAEQRWARVVPYLFTNEWTETHPSYWDAMPRNTQVSSNNTLNLELDASFSWKGVCNQFEQFKGPTLIITGTEDQMIPSSNSLAIAERIPGAWLLQLENGGHGMMYQYPEKMSKVIQTFLDVTSS
jgi:pimeloyl-ACP methyl ester carboxylesterase